MRGAAGKSEEEDDLLPEPKYQELSGDPFAGPTPPTSPEHEASPGIADKMEAMCNRLGLVFEEAEAEPAPANEKPPEPCEPATDLVAVSHLGEDPFLPRTRGRGGRGRARLRGGSLVPRSRCHSGARHQQRG